MQVDIDVEADDYEIKTFATKEEADAYLTDAAEALAALKAEVK